MGLRSFQRAFSGGELSPEMFGRLDDARYQDGLARCRNFIVKPHGPVENRGGFGFVREVKSSGKKVKLISFTYSTTQTMVLEFGDHYLRFHTRGATLLDTDDEVYEIATPYAAADLFDLHHVQSADILTLVHPSYPPSELRRYGALDWRLEPIVFTPSLAAPNQPTLKKAGMTSAQYALYYVVTAIDASGVSESTASPMASINGNLFETGATVTISWDAVPGAARYNVYKMQGGVYGYIGQTEMTSIVDDNIGPDLYKVPPIYDNPFQDKGVDSVTVMSGGSGYASTTEGGGIDSVHLPDTYYLNTYSREVVVQISDATGSGAVVTVTPDISEYENDWNLVTGPVVIDKLKFTVVSPGSGYTNPTAILHDPGAHYSEYDPGGGPTYQYFHQGPDAPLAISATPVVASVRLVVDDPTGTGAYLIPTITDGEITAVTVAASGVGYTNPTVRVVSSLGGSGAEFSVTLADNADYPGAVSYFEQRRVFAGTKNRPQHIWMTKSGTESNMSYSLPTRDDDRISFRVAAREANTVRHIVPLSQLLLLTSSAEWRVTSLNSDAITPTTISVRPQSYVGASNVQPVIINNTLIYAASRGGHARELAYNWQANGFLTGDLSLRSTHLFENFEIVDMAFAKAPVPIVWFVSGSGKLLGLTYVPEQQIGAWHVHETDGAFESCCVVAEGDDDVLYCVVKREIGGQMKRYIERMTPRRFNAPEDAFFVDSGLSYRGKAVSSLSGLSHLEGKTVSILADGAAHPRRVVEGGRVTLAAPSSVVHVGLPITAELETLPLAIGLKDGSFGQGRVKNVNKVWLRVYRSSGLFVGPAPDDLREVKPRTTEAYGSPPRLKTEEIEMDVPPDWTKGGQVFIRQVDPLPLTVVSLTVDIALGG
jgi:hypothetical protein